MTENYAAFVRNIQDDIHKNDSFLHLTPNENVLSDTARQFYANQIADRYYFGKSSNGKNVDLYGFTALGYTNLDALIKKAEEILAKRFLANSANLSPISGIHAMICVIAAATSPNDTVLTLDSQSGGHYATQHILRRFGRKPINIPSDSKHAIDFGLTAELVRESQATAIYLDPAYSLDNIDVGKLREVVGEDITIIYDASHTLGLIMGGAYPNPLAHGADIICANTHKTFPGPQKGMIIYKDGHLAQEVDSTLQEGLYSSVHTGSLLALAITILEMDMYGEQYAQQIIANANHLGRCLEKLGFDVVKLANNKFTNTHQIHLITKNIGSYTDLYERLYDTKIAVAFDKAQIFSYGEFVRIGVQELTRRGAKEPEMECIARALYQALTNGTLDATLKHDVEELKQTLRLKIHYSFDEGVDHENN